MQTPSVVSITGVPLIGRLDVNGDYVLTDEIINSYPIFRKMNHENDGWSSDDLVIRMGIAQKSWSVNPLDDRFSARNNLCQIIIPDNVNDKSLEALAQRHDVRVSLFANGHRHDFPESHLTPKLSANALVDKRDKRQGMLDQNQECYICMQETRFRYFRVPKCGHACCQICYDLWLRTSDKCGMCKQRLKDSNGNDQSTSVDQLPKYALLFVREDDASTNAGMPQSTDAKLQTSFKNVQNKYAVTMMPCICSSRNKICSAAEITKARRGWVAV